MSKRKLLLADDSVTIQKVVNLTFADEGIDVITVGNGDLAMQKIAEEQPDMVLIDVNMPGMSGYEICERLRSNQNTENLPIMLLVGSFEPFDEEEANRVGANGFLTKPFQSIRQLVAKVSELMPPEAEEAERDDDNAEGLDEPWAAAVTDEPETDDIDNLYKQSFAETLESPDSDTASAAAFAADGESYAETFADAGMDDEMIETSYLAATAGQTEGAAAASESFTSPFEETVTDSFERSFDERQEAGAAPDTEVADEESSTEPPAGEYREGEGLVLNQSPASFETEPLEGTAGSEQSVSADHQDAEEPQKDDTLRGGVAFDVAPEADFEFDGSNLLELPPPPISNAATRITSADDPRAGGQLVSLSPELMEEIVRRVLERMSAPRG